MRKLLKRIPATLVKGVGDFPVASDIDSLKKTYSIIEPFIVERLNEFSAVYISGNNKRLFAELAFCILTPQSNARYCWDAVCGLYENETLFCGAQKDILNYLGKVRFKYKKSAYIVAARKLFFNTNMDIRKKIEEFDNTVLAREWFTEHIKGYGLKETSHFLRNLGMGKSIAILDRHILRNLEKYRVIDSIPKSLPRAKYYEIENKYKQFSEGISIPLEHMDLLFWYNVKGEIFK